MPGEPNNKENSHSCVMGFSADSELVILTWKIEEATFGQWGDVPCSYKRTLGKLVNICERPSHTLI